MLCSALGASADVVDGAIVASGGAQTQFPISDIMEITFGDSEMTVTKIDHTTATFPGECRKP